MNKLTKLTIKKFRNVAPTTLEFRPGLNVLLGKNAAGKTTLLRLLSTAVGRPEEALQDDMLDVSYRSSSPALAIEHGMTRARVNEPVLTPDPSQPGRYELSGIQQTDSFIIEKNGAVVLKAEVLPNEIKVEETGQWRRKARMFWMSPQLSLAMSLSTDSASNDTAILGAELFIANINTIGRIDESLERFNTLLKLEVSVEEHGQGKISTWNMSALPESLHSMLLQPIPEGTAATFSPGFLERAARALGYDSASARFDVERLSPEPSRHIVRLSNLRFFFKRSGEEISHDLLSYGQKRLLAFFAHADASRDVVIADELVNGLHHEWISACLQEIGDRQAFLTSQNPLLLDFLRFDSIDEVRRTFILCERASGEAGAQLIWRNPSEDEAESFFLAYQTGVQRVSDILLTKGLW